MPETASADGVSDADRPDVLILGAGPGGYVAAIRCSQLGLKTAIVEKEPALGGTCLRVGCIPSKALLESSHLFEEASHAFEGHGIIVDQLKLNLDQMMQRKNKVVKQLTQGVAGLMKKNKVEVLHGTASFNDDRSVTVRGEAGERTLHARNVVIATGSKVTDLPGIDMSLSRVDTSTEALTYEAVPRKLILIGGGVIGLELGSVWRRLGAEVVVLEYLDRILPGMDAELAKEAKKFFEKQGITFKLGTKVTGIEQFTEGQTEQVRVTVEGGEPVVGDRALVAIGRRPNTDGLNLEAVGIETNKKGQIPIDGATLRTPAWSDPDDGGVGIYAIGDVVEGPMLAHKAEEEGVAVAELIATGHGHVAYDHVPAVVYTDPEIASAGKTEEELKEAGTAYSKGKFPLLANGRALAIDAATGFVKILADKETDRILGCHIIARGAGDLIQEVVAGMQFGASAEDIARTCHAHPTLSESVKEAALAVDGRALHV